MNSLAETGQIHNRINLYLLENIDEINLNDITTSKASAVGEQFVYMQTLFRTDLITWDKL
jgi:hypothetical protein